MTVPSSEADPTVGCPSTRREPLTSSEVRFPDHTNRLPSDSDPAFCDTPESVVRKRPTWESPPWPAIGGPD